MKPWIRIERIPGMLASAYIKATRMVIDSYYRPVAEEIAATMNRGLVLDLGTGPGHLPGILIEVKPLIMRTHSVATRANTPDSAVWRPSSRESRSSSAHSTTCSRDPGTGGCTSV